jgi:HEAT repeat protein
LTGDRPGEGRRETAPGATSSSGRPPRGPGLPPDVTMIRLREALSSNDPRVRAESIARTGGLPGAEPFLIGALGDQEPVVRRAAVRALSRRQSAGSARALIRAASSDPEAPVRLEAIAALGRVLRFRLGRGTGAAPT